MLLSTECTELGSSFVDLILLAVIYNNLKWHSANGIRCAAEATFMYGWSE